MIYDLSKRVDQYVVKGKIERYIEKGKRIEFKLWRKSRSTQQNRYLHVCLGLIAKETGYTLEEAKSVCKRQFGRFMVYEKNGERFLTSTRDLDTVQVTEFIDHIRHTAIETLGIYIPTPEQYMEDPFELEQYLELQL